MVKRIALVFLLLSPLAALARDSGTTALISEDAYLAEMPTVLTVSRLSQPVDESPAAVTVIDQETIRASGIIDLPDIFRLVPGMYVGANAGYFYTVNPVVSYHGMTDAYSRRMQVQIDGRTVYQPLYGGVQWSDLPLAIGDIERIEVTRGPNAASYGANAFLGIINIITQHSSEAAGNSASLTQGNGRKEAFYRHGDKIGDLNYRVTVGYRKDDGLVTRADNKRTRLLSARGDYRLTNKDELEFQFGYSEGSRGEGNLGEDSLLFLPRDKQVNSHFELMRWQRNLGRDGELSVKAYHAYDQSEDEAYTTNLQTQATALGRSLRPRITILLTNPRQPISVDTQSDRYELEAQHTFSPWSPVRIAWGGSLRLDRTEAPLFLGTSKTQDFRLQQLFGHAEWHVIPRLVLNAGAMVEHNDVTGTDLSPRASANFKLAPDHTLRIGISKATRTPTYLEEKFHWNILLPTTTPGIPILLPKYADQGGLTPERITSREIGYVGSIGALSLDGRWYRDHIEDTMQSHRVTPVIPSGFIPYPNNRVFGFVNKGSAIVRGFEAQAQLRFATQSRIIANYSHIRISGTNLEANFVNSAPINSYSLLAWHNFTPQWNASVGYYHVGETTTTGDGAKVALNRHWDARVAHRFVAGNYHGELSVVAQNLFDNHYNEFSTYNTMSRRAYVNLKLDF